MKKMFLASFLFCMPMVTGLMTAPAAAQQPSDAQPMIEKRVKELGLAGNIDFLGTEGGVDADISASFGYFIGRYLEVGPMISFSRQNDGDVMNYGLGAFAEYHLVGASLVKFAETVPYIGASLGLDFLDTDVGDDEAGVTFTPRIGIKWFIRNYVAVDTNIYLSVASDDIYVNDGDKEDYDVGLNIGLRVYFK